MEKQTNYSFYIKINKQTIMKPTNKNTQKARKTWKGSMAKEVTQILIHHKLLALYQTQRDYVHFTAT